MPFKIYTYKDPYRIHETDFWVDHNIKNYPQLCASRTMVNGLLNVMPKEIVSLMCPLDDIVKKRVFRDWDGNIGNRIQQYSALSEIYKVWNKEKGLSDVYFQSLTHNKDSMLDSIRLFIELGIKADTLDARKLNMEHRMFVYMLKMLEKNKLFALPPMPSLKELREIFNKQAQFEKDEKERLKGDREEDAFYARDIQIIDKMIENTKKWDGKHIVIHGIHQFTPLQLRFITHLDQLGVEVIFLYNYLPEFKEIYSSWSYIYQHFNAPIHHDDRIKSYVPTGQLQKISNAIASNMGMLCEETIIRTDPLIRSNYELYKNERVQEFDNISEYAGYLSDEFMEAERNLYEEIPLYERPTYGKVGTAQVLARMKEVVYTANKDVDSLLQVYHPEYARNRHFLAYPIGQFFAAIYASWNVERNEIDIDYSLIRECVNSGVLTQYSAERLLKTLINVEPLFANITTFSEFEKIFGDKFRKAYKQVSDSKQGAIAFPLKHMNLYNSYKVTQVEIDELFSAISEVNNIAKELFSDIESDTRFQFGKHFERLGEFVRARQNSLANEEEKELIRELLVKLDMIQMFSDDETGTFEDLRNGLYYFLKQKEEPVSDWFVKNFEQIDGDILNSKLQNAVGKKKVYHFACVSDKDMNCKIDDLLPWPLSEMFIEKAYNPKELPFQVYYAALGERSNFLRYALFYGLYFNQCDTKISFVKRYGEETTDYYEMLKLVGLKKEDGTSRDDLDECNMGTVTRAKKVTTLAYNREQMADMFLCPYKYLLDYVLNPQPIFSGSFLIQKYFENILIENTWKILEGKPQDYAKEKLSLFVNQEAQKLRGYFTFLRDTEILDLQRRVENYIEAKVFVDGYQKVRKCEETHMKLRKTFGDALFTEDLQDNPEKHVYAAFENLTSIEDGQKVYSIHKVYKEDDQQLLTCALDYINNKNDNLARSGSWCVFCPNKGICLEPFSMKNQ